MISTHEEYEAALERLIACLEHPGSAESAEDGLGQLWSDIQRYRPGLAAADKPPKRSCQNEAEALVERARALVAARDERLKRQQYATFPEDGLGIGPTTGI